MPPGPVRICDVSKSILTDTIADSCAALQSLAAQEATFDQLAAATVHCLRTGHKVLTCGNGGSGADAMHMAEEFIARYRSNRRSLPAVCLNADPTVLTCIANDFGYNAVFARQVEGLGVRGDLLVCFTTSGNSVNCLRALAVAKAQGLVTVALLGKDGGQAKGVADFEIIVGHRDTARIQEAHTLILHALLEVVEHEFPAE